MTAPKPTEPSSVRALRHLLHPDPMVSAALKGHLLIEESLNRLLAGLARAPEHIDQAALRLSFHQKQKLVRAFGPPAEGETAVWRLIELLNALRNDLAHTLESEGFDAKLDALLTEWAKLRITSPFVDPDEGPEARITGVVSYCLGWLWGYEKEVTGINPIGSDR